MLRVLIGRMEQCAPDKGTLKTLCPHIWIHYIISGRGYYNGQSLGRGDAFIVYTGDYCEYCPEPSDPWKYIWIRLYGDDSERLLERCGFPRDSGVFRFSYAEKLIRICEHAFCEDAPYEIYLDENRIYAESLAKMILSLNIGESDVETGEGRERWVRRAKSYIRANFHRELRVEDIANTLHVDRKYLRNLFVAYTGESTQQYIMRLRLTHAETLLRETDKSVGIIASSVGYQDMLCFSRAFKKHVGVSPSMYRKRNRP